MELLTNPQVWLALVTLTALEIVLVPCNIKYFVIIQSMLYWRQLNQGGRHVTEISSNSYRAGAQRA